MTSPQPAPDIAGLVTALISFFGAITALITLIISLYNHSHITTIKNDLTQINGSLQAQMAQKVDVTAAAAALAAKADAAAVAAALATKANDASAIAGIPPLNVPPGTPLPPGGP